MSTTEAPSTETLHIAAVAPIAQPSVCSDSSVPVKSVVAAVADISGEFDTLSIGQNGDETSSKEEPNTKSDPAESLSVIQDEATTSPSKKLNGETSPAVRMLVRNGDSCSTPSENAEKSSPLIVVSPQEPFSHQTQTVICDPVDQPDPRLLDALENPRDRIFVIKLEKDIVAFIEDKSCEIFDMPPINSYHRLLAHKMAEYYRLTHVADATGGSVRMFRGQAARIPATQLTDWPVATQQLQKAVSTGALPAVKIMRRGGSDSDSRKAGSDASSDNDNSINTSASQKTTFEEREAAYNEARARIFKDFVESPPDTPPPGKQEKSRRQDKNDDFSGRSQFYPVMQPIQAQYYPQQGYHDALMQTAMQQPMLPTMAQLQQQQMQQQHHVPSQQRFNPTANFTPSNFTPPQQFSPSAPPFSTIPPSRSYPNFNTARERGYPAPIPQHQTQPPHQQQQVYPQQPNGYYPPPQTPPTMHGTRSYNPGHPQPPMMQSSYSSSGGFPQQQAQFNNPATTPPPINRQLQQQQQYPMHHTNQHQSFTPQRMPQQPQPQHQPLGWGGVAMAPRSSSAPGHQLHHTGLPESHAHAAIGTGMNGYGGGAVGTGAWGSGGGVAWNGGNVVGRGGGVGGGGMNMRM